MTDDRSEQPADDQARTDHPGADEHYRDARYYDHAYARYKADRAFYVDLARRIGGPVLELGVGTGRLAIALAEDGVEVVGVDRMEPMLERARERIAKKPKRIRDALELIWGDVRDVRLDRRFPLVIAPFNVLQHLYTRTDIERALATVRAHLEVDGCFALDVLMPDPVSLARDPQRFYKCRPTRHPRDDRRYRYEEAFLYDHDRQVQTTVMRFTALDGSRDRLVDKLPQRQFFPRELEALLHYNGLEVVSHHGGFAGQPIDESTESQVVIARMR